MLIEIAGGGAIGLSWAVRLAAAGCLPLRAAGEAPGRLRPDPFSPQHP